jgi:hypothetical protein
MPWTSLSATPPVLRRIRSLSAAGDYVYIVGGIDINWDGMNRFDRYNVQTGLWVALTAPGMEIGEPAQVAGMPGYSTNDVVSGGVTPIVGLPTNRSG